MKYPKNRASLYLVSRKFNDNEPYVVGAFLDMESADLFGEACLQNWLDQRGTTDGVVFTTNLTTFYET